MRIIPYNSFCSLLDGCSTGRPLEDGAQRFFDVYAFFARSFCTAFPPSQTTMDFGLPLAQSSPLKLDPQNFAQLSCYGANSDKQGASLEPTRNDESVARLFGETEEARVPPELAASEASMRSERGRERGLQESESEYRRMDKPFNWKSVKRQRLFAAEATRSIGRRTGAATCFDRVIARFALSCRIVSFFCSSPT